MLPSLRHRLIIAAAALLGAVCFLYILPNLRAPDGSDGVSLFSAAAGPFKASLLVALAGLPVLVLGLFVSASGNPLSGIFAVAVALTVLAGAGGPIDHWMWRSNLPGDFRELIYETLIWQAGIVAMLIFIHRLRLPLRSRVPMLAFNDHVGADTALGFPGAQSLGAGLVATAAAGTAAYLLLRSNDIGQVIAALVIAFTLGGLLGQLVFPQSNPIAIFFSPMLVAVLSYGYVIFNYTTNDRVLLAWYTHRLPGTALVLPIYYASAAIAGCAMGVGMAHTLAPNDTASAARPDSARPA